MIVIMSLRACLVNSRIYVFLYEHQRTHVNKGFYLAEMHISI